MNAVEMQSLSLADQIRNEEIHRTAGMRGCHDENEEEHAQLIWARGTKE